MVVLNIGVQIIMQVRVTRNLFLFWPAPRLRLHCAHCCCCCLRNKRQKAKQKTEGESGEKVEGGGKEEGEKIVRQNK